MEKHSHFMPNSDIMSNLYSYINKLTKLLKYSHPMKPLITIWYRPIQTFDYLIEKSESSILDFLIFWMLGLTISIRNVLPEHELFGPIISIVTILIGSVISAILFQLIWIILLWLTGKILQGKAQIECSIQLAWDYEILEEFMSTNSESTKILKMKCKVHFFMIRFLH